MARRRESQHDANQYGLDFHSAGDERRQLLMSALTVTGLMRYEQLARLVLYMQEQAGGDPLGWPIARYAQALGRQSERTVQRWIGELAAVGILDVIERRRQRGGQQTNLVAINWPIVRLFALDRIELDRHGRLERRQRGANRGDKKSVTPGCNRVTPPRNRVTPIVSPPIKELSTYSSSSSELPHAAEAPTATTSPRSEEEESFLKEISGTCRNHLGECTPRALDSALRQALDNGLTTSQLRQRCRWFCEQKHRWLEKFRAGAFHNGIRDATPDMPPNQGWPHQK